MSGDRTAGGGASARIDIAEPAVKTVQVGGVRMSYQESGQGEPVLLVHGNFGSKRWFSDQLAHPPAGYRLLAPDLPNFAHSDPMPEEISIATYAGYLGRFCDELGLGRLALVGHSLGGAVAQAFATAQPERVDRLLLVASAAPDGHPTPEEHYPFLEALRGNREAMANALAATMPTRLPPYFDGIVDDALAMQPAAFSGNGRALASYDVTDRSRSFEGLVLVIRGELDLPHLITEEIARRTAAAYPNARLESWKEVGHSPPVEAPDRFNDALESFLKEQP